MRRRALLGIKRGGGNGSGIDINNYLTMEALEDGLTATLTGNDCEYCIDGSGEWISLPSGNETISIDSGHTLSFKANLYGTNAAIGQFSISAKCNLLGECNSMLHGDDLNASLHTRAFHSLFRSAINIIDASQLVLRATSATTYCYGYMFEGCSNLKHPPQIKLTTLANYCMEASFRSCTSLEESPELLASTSKSYCYYMTFRYCSSLKKITCMLTSSVSNKATSSCAYWTEGVASEGVFVCSTKVNMGRGIHSIPENWTLEKI